MSVNRVPERKESDLIWDIQKQTIYVLHRCMDCRNFILAPWTSQVVKKTVVVRCRSCASSRKK